MSYWYDWIHVLTPQDSYRVSVIPTRDLYDNLTILLKEKCCWEFVFDCEERNLPRVTLPSWLASARMISSQRTRRALAYSSRRWASSCPTNVESLSARISKSIGVIEPSRSASESRTCRIEREKKKRRSQYHINQINVSFFHPKISLFLRSKFN